jgi:hypothetical protein
MSLCRNLRDAIAARHPAPTVDEQILSGHEAHGGRAVRLRADYLVSPRHRQSIAGGLRNRPWVRDPRIQAAYQSIASRLESPEPITARGMLRLVRLLTTAPSAVAVGNPETVVRELGTITYLLDVPEGPRVRSAAESFHDRGMGARHDSTAGGLRNRLVGAGFRGW